MLYLKVLVPIVVGILALANLLLRHRVFKIGQWHDKRTSAHRRLVGTVAWLILAFTVLSAVIAFYDFRLLERRSQEAQKDRAALTKEIHELRSTLTPFRQIAQSRFPTLDTAAALSKLATEIVALQGRAADLESRANAVQSVAIQVTLDVPTPSMAVTAKSPSVGLAGPIALFDRENTRYRFVADLGRFEEHQLAPTIHRFIFTYGPEDPQQILGKPVSFLGRMESLAVDYSDFFKDFKIEIDASKPCFMHVLILVNGIEVAKREKVPVQPALILRGRGVLEVSREFSTLASPYAQAIRSKAAAQR